MRGGGALRSFHLLRQLARFHEVHAVVFQPEAKLRQEADGYKVPDSVQIYSPIDNPAPVTPFTWLPARLACALQYRWLRRNLRGPASAELLHTYHLFAHVLARVKIQVAIFEGLGTMTIAPLVHRMDRGVRRVLDAHNVDSCLLEQQLKQASTPSVAARLLSESKRLRHIETNLAREVDTVLACSEEDRQWFVSHNPHLEHHVIPNGVDAQRFRPSGYSQGQISKEVLFCGSLRYSPNIEGLNWFLEAMWPALKQADSEVRLSIVGQGGKQGDFPLTLDDARVEFVGEVDDVRPYYHRAAVAICPLRLGSGTRLKILEAMACGTPVVSTSLGAQGLDAPQGTHWLCADTPADFCRAIEQLLTNDSLHAGVRLAGRQVVEAKYDWDVIGLRLTEVLSAFRPEPEHAR